MPCGVECVGASSACAEAHELFFAFGLGCAFVEFSNVFGTFWEAKMEPKIDFGRVFCDVFFELVLESSFWRFFLFFLNPNLKFCAPSQCFVTIFAKSTHAKTIWGQFWRSKRRKITEKMLLKSMLFWNIDFYVFFCGF